MPFFSRLIFWIFNTYVTEIGFYIYYLFMNLKYYFNTHDTHFSL